MGWRVDSTAGATVWDTEPLARDDLALRDEEIQWLMRQGRPWRLTNGRLRGGSWKARDGAAVFDTPLMNAEGTYGALAAYPLPVAQAALTLSATEQLLVPLATLPVYLPLPINGILAPQAYRIVVAGNMTTGLTPGNLTAAVRIGNTITSPSLGALAASALTASITAGVFYLFGDITVQSIGLPGANSKAVGNFTLHWNTVLNSTGATVCWSTGATPASFDSTIAAGANGGCLNVGVARSGSTAETITVNQIHLMDWN